MHYMLRCLLVGWLAASLIFSGCGRQANPVRYRIVVIPKGVTHHFWKSIHAGAKAAVEGRQDVEIVWRGPDSEDQRQQQQDIVQQFTSEGVTAIILAPTDRQTLTAPVEGALAKGIPIVIIDSGLELTPAITRSEKYLGYVATDNEEGGRQAAQRLVELLKGKETARVLMMRYQTGSQSTELRERGFEAEIRKHPQIELTIPNEEAGATVESALKASERVLANQPQLDGLFTPNESSTEGMLRALEATRRLGSVKMVGFDGSEFLIDALRRGHLQGLVLQDPFDMGRQAVLRVLNALEGRRPANLVQHTNLQVATPENLEQPAIRALYAPR